jgi:vacuolar-type H+-ATPase subunit E/Vma4
VRKQQQAGKHPGQPAGQHQAEQHDLIDGIEQDAAREVERILGEAEKAAEERKAAAEAQARAVIQQGESKAEEQAEQVRERSASSLRMERRRRQLKLQEQAVQEVLKRSRQRLAEMVGSPAYREVLLTWIVEAAIGLGTPEATVNASAAERKQIDRQLLQDAQDKIRALSGRTVRLKTADEDPLIPQGIVLKAADGRVEYNNQVATRLLRRQSEIRKTIQDIVARTPSSVMAKTPHEENAGEGTPHKAK